MENEININTETLTEQFRKLNQALEIVIKDDSNEEPSRIKEETYSINTLSVQEASIFTNEIEGELKCIIIKTTKPITLKISIPDVAMILDIVQFSGDEYIIPKHNASDFRGERANYNGDLWTLKDKLLLEVSGGMHTEVEFIFRYV